MLNLIKALFAILRLRKKAARIGRGTPQEAASLVRNRASTLEASTKSPYMDGEQLNAAVRDVSLLHWAADTIEYVFQLGTAVPQIPLLETTTEKPSFPAEPLDRIISDEVPSAKAEAEKLRFQASRLEFKMQKAAASDTLTEDGFAETKARIVELREQADGLDTGTKATLG